MSPATYPAYLKPCSFHSSLFRGLSKKLLPFCDCGSCVLLLPRAHLSPSPASPRVELLALTSRHCLACFIPCFPVSCPFSVFFFLWFHISSPADPCTCQTAWLSPRPGRPHISLLQTFRMVDFFTCQHPVQPTPCPQNYRHNKTTSTTCVTKQRKIK